MPFYKDTNIYKSHGSGWDHLVDPLIEEVLKVGGRILQIKEKFGTLRFYHETPAEHYERIEDLVRQAEKASETVCEDCGKPGTLRRDLYWINTLCDECHNIELSRQREHYRELTEDENA